MKKFLLLALLILTAVTLTRKALRAPMFYVASSDMTVTPDFGYGGDEDDGDDDGLDCDDEFMVASL